MKRTATISPVVDARSQFVGGFACSWLDRCGRGSPARLLSHNRALCEQFGRDWVVGCSRWIGTTVGIVLSVPFHVSATMHVFMGVSATLGVVSCGCLDQPELAYDSRMYGEIEVTLGDDMFVEHSMQWVEHSLLWGETNIVNGEGNLVAALDEVACEGMASEAHATPKRLIVWRRDRNNGVPVARGVGVRCTVPLSGDGVKLSLFDPCGDEIVFVGAEEGRGIKWLSSISFVDLEKSIEAGDTVVVSKKSVVLPPHSIPYDLIWSSPGTILILVHRDEHGETGVYNTVTGHSWSFSERYTRISTLQSEYITALCNSECDVYTASSADLSQPSYHYEFTPTQGGIRSTSKELYGKTPATTPTSSRGYSAATIPHKQELEVFIGDTITGNYLAILTFSQQ
ncbi:hypothetical protein Pelo_18563 [Pelomyxa schiedti]|nr:hypothetical protein Pelo_18563 [Pelomyxa schiedti]